MLTIEDRFRGAYMHALNEALLRNRVKVSVDAEIAVMFDWFKGLIQGGIVKKKRAPSLIELPILFSLRFQRDPERRTRFVRHLFLDCSRQEKRNAHDRAILRSAYLAALLEGREPDEARGEVLRQYNTGFLFTSDVGVLAKDGLLLPLSGDEKSPFSHVPAEARMFSTACFGAVSGPETVKLAPWQETLIHDKQKVKDLGWMLFNQAYGYLD